MLMVLFYPEIFYYLNVIEICRFHISIIITFLASYLTPQFRVESIF